MTVSPQTEECVYVLPPAEGKNCFITGQYDMIDDELSPNPVTVIIFDSEFEIVWHSKPGVAADKFALDTNCKRHQLCIANGDPNVVDKNDPNVKHFHHHRGHPNENHHIDDDEFDYKNKDGKDREVGFTFQVKAIDQFGRVVDRNRWKKPKPNQMGESTKRLEMLAADTRNNINSLMDKQMNQKEREERHVELAEQTFNILFRWTLLEAVVLIGVSTAQVMYLRRFFEVKRYL